MFSCCLVWLIENVKPIPSCFEQNLPKSIYPFEQVCKWKHDSQGHFKVKNVFTNMQAPYKSVQNESLHYVWLMGANSIITDIRKCCGDDRDVYGV